MTKAEVVSEIAKNTGIEKVLVYEVIENFMETVRGSIVEGDNIYLRGFGSFVLKTRAEKVARNIGPNTAIMVPAHNVPAFKPAKEFLLAVRNKK